MKKSAKVAISLPVDIYETVEKSRIKKGESRSEYFRHAVEKLLKEEQEAKDIEAYITSYTSDPETAEDVKTTDKLGAAALAEEIW